MCTCSAATFITGACKSQKPSSETIEAISDAALQTLCAGSAITNLPVFATDSKIVCLSNGTKVRGSITSTEMPSASSSSAARRAIGTAPAMATTVTSSPERGTSATPNGTNAPSPSSTSPDAPDSVPSSKTMHGSSSRIAVFSNPLASRGVAGTRILKPGMFINMGYDLSEWCAADPPP